MTTPADGPVSDRVPAPVVNPALEEPPRTRVVFDRVARVVGHSLRSLMDVQDRSEVGGDWMTRGQPRGRHFFVHPLRLYWPNASGVGTEGFRVPKPMVYWRRSSTRMVAPKASSASSKNAWSRAVRYETGYHGGTDGGPRCQEVRNGPGPDPS